MKVIVDGIPKDAKDCDFRVLRNGTYYCILRQVVEINGVSDPSDFKCLADDMKKSVSMKNCPKLEDIEEYLKRELLRIHEDYRAVEQHVRNHVGLYRSILRIIDCKCV